MPLTPGEKKARKAEKKAQKLREAEEQRIKIRKDELSREVRTSRLNIEEHMKRWYLSNYSARFPFIKQEMEVAWHMFEHCLDIKEFVVAELMNRMDEARFQEAMTWQDFTLKIDSIISDFEQRVNLANAEYREKQRELLFEGVSQGLVEDVSQLQLQEYLKTVLYIMEQQFAESNTLAQGEYMTRRDEESKKGQHARELMSAALEKNLNSTVMEIRHTLTDYRESTESRQRELEMSRLRDEYYMNMIKRQDIKMNKLYEELSSLQIQMNARYETRLVLEDLKKDREETYTEYMEVRASLTREANQDEDKLLTLTFESNRHIKDLQRILGKGEKILRLVGMCRKLETQEEKVLPFGIPVDIADGSNEGKVTDPFALFWRRFANAKLIKKKLEPTLYKLQQENEDLKEQLKFALDMMSTTQPF